MHRNDRLRLAVLLTLSVMFIACGPGATPGPEATASVPQATLATGPAIPLEGTVWKLATMRGVQPVPGSSMTLGFFEDDYLEGSAGCNSFGANYTASGEVFRLAQIHRTDMECGEPLGIMAQDQAFFELLASIDAYRATEDRLEFLDGAGEAILVYTPKLPPPVDPALLDTEWLLTSLRGESPLEGSRITLNLGAERFTGVAGCNNYGGEYEAADEGILRTSELYQTEMDCPTPGGIMEQEAAYLGALRSAAAYMLVQDRLELADERGETVLIYARKDQFDTDPGALVGTAWRLLSIDGESPGGAPALTLIFYSETILGGYAGCRDYLASYEASGDDLRLVLEVMLDGDCRVEDADLGLDAGFLDAMAPKADVRLRDDQLEIYGERGGVLILEPLPEDTNLDLEGPTWTLLAFVGPNPYVQEPEPWPVPTGLLYGTTISLAFEEGTARGSGGCNRYGSVVSVDGSSMSFEAVVSTEMACLDPEGLMEQEGGYLEVLGAVRSYRVFGDRLWLETGDGRGLVFYGR